MKKFLYLILIFTKLTAYNSQIIQKKFRTSHISKISIDDKNIGILSENIPLKITYGIKINRKVIKEAEISNIRVLLKYKF